MGGDRSECSDPKYKEKKESGWRLKRESQLCFFFLGGVGISGNVTPRSTPRGEIRLI